MAGRIPQSFIDELLNRVDIVEVIDSRVPLKKGGRDYMACCPFHDEKTPSFTVSPTKQFYHCFGCGAHGTAIGFLMEHERLGFVDAVEELAASLNMEIPYEDGAPVKSGNQDLYPLLEKASAFFQQQLRSHAEAPKAVDYLKNRGLSGDIARDYGLGYAPPGWDNLAKYLGQDKQTQDKMVLAGLSIRKDNGGCYDRFRDRVMFPIRDRRGRVIGFGGRVLDKDDDGPKYLNSPETPVFHKGRELYGLYEVRQAIRHPEQIMVVEGYMDVVALAQFGIRYAVATLGTATTAEHLQTLFRATSRVVFCFDGDRAGRDAAWRALQTALPLMSGGHEARFLFLPEGEDPDTLIRQEGREAFEERVNNAKTLSWVMLEQLQRDCDMSTPEGRSRLIELSKPLLAKIPDGAYRHMLTEQLGQMTRVQTGQISQLVGQSEVRREFRPRPKQARSAATRTPVRIAISLLLNDPGLAQRVDNPAELADAATPGMDLLVELLEFLKQNPDIRISAVLERWRERPEGAHLAKLASTDIPGEAETHRQEFDETITYLADLRSSRRLAELQLKLEAGQLSEDEKTEWRHILNRKSSDNPDQL